MPSKRNLSAALGGELPKKNIQKGEGFRLSATSEQEAEMHSRVQDREPEIGTSAHRQESTRAQEHKSTRAQDVQRPSKGQRIRLDYLKEIKRIAFEEERNDYEVIEEALEEYLKKKGRL
jgi:hypothetical protein